MYVYVFDDCVRKEPAWKQMFFVQFKLESNLSQNDNFFFFFFDSVCVVEFLKNCNNL